MDVLQIWVKEDGFTWLVGAFDSESLAETDEPFLRAKNAAIESYGADNVRVIIQSIDMDAVDRAFQTVRVPAGTVREQGATA